jgi:hypothetical protein
MAKIFITGRPPVETNESEAIRIREMWEASKEKGKEALLPRVIDAGGAIFEGKDIRGFEIVDYRAKEQKNLEYNINDPAQKAKVKEFEKEFTEWCVVSGAHYAKGEKFNHFLQDKGAIKIIGGYWQFETISIEKFNDLNKLFSSLNSLRAMRHKAKQHELEALNSQIAETKENIRMRDKAQLQADAAAYDTEHGTGKVRIEDIPF